MAVNQPIFMLRLSEPQMDLSRSKSHGNTSLLSSPCYFLDLSMFPPILAVIHGDGL